MTKAYNAGFTADPKNPIYSTGKVLKTVVATFSTTTTANDYAVLAQSLPSTAIIRGIRFPQGTGATSGNTDIDFGFYAHEGAVVDKDALADGVSFAAAKGAATDVLGSNIASFDFKKTIGELLGVATKDQPIGGYDLCATVNTGAAGTYTAEILIEMA